MLFKNKYETLLNMQHSGTTTLPGWIAVNSVLTGTMMKCKWMTRVNTKKYTQYEKKNQYIWENIPHHMVIKGKEQ